MTWIFASTSPVFSCVIWATCTSVGSTVGTAAAEMSASAVSGGVALAGSLLDVGFEATGVDAGGAAVGAGAAVGFEPSRVAEPIGFAVFLAGFFAAGFLASEVTITCWTGF